jgi:hypothetical protein
MAVPMTIARGAMGGRLAALLAVFAVGAACARTAGSPGGAGDPGVSEGGPTSEAGFVPSDAGLGAMLDAPGANPSSLAIAPTNATVIVTITDGVVTAPTLQFTATSQGSPVDVGWSVDQGAVATISSSGLFTPTGASGGVVDVIAGYGAARVSTTVTVILQRTQNGFTGPIDLTGPGGYGGVGGEGPGPPVDMTTSTALQATPSADPTRTLLYPYDGTVWPRGLLAPLLQWTPGAQDPTALRLHLESATYVYDGYFGRPAALAMTSPFVRHPIPQDVWQQATESTAGTDELRVSLVLLENGHTFGPLTESWKVAPGILQGTVYYESYGTLLLANSDQNAQDGSKFGAGVLGIKPGATAPIVIAGADTDAGQPSGTGCRGCHSVAAQGSRLLTQDNAWDYRPASAYDLKTLAETAIAETPPPSASMGTFFYAGLSPDGQYALTNAPEYLNSTQLYRIAPGGAATVLTTAGLPAPGAAGQVQGATPAFSPDGKHVAFTHVAGTLGTLSGDGTHLVTMDFDPSGPSLSGARSVFTLPSGSTQTDCAGFPSFLPTSDALLVQLQLEACGADTQGPSYVGTWNVHGEIWWADTATGTQHRLDALDGYTPAGDSYLPTGSSGHADDTKLNYEPTVNPAPSGGYAWVVFTSRRLYGNVAVIDPFTSDPRMYDYKNPSQVTTKKLWVAAIDLHAPPGTDPSHPAFYLPAQELQAGNARGYWVLDPCRADGTACESGDQCCGGYCQALGDGGSLICASQTTTCSLLGDKCAAASACCDTSAECIDGYCAIPAPR